MKKIMIRAALALSLFLTVPFFLPQSLAQRSDSQGQRGPSAGDEQDLIAQFDENKNGRLEKGERTAALADLKNNPRPARRGKGGRGKGGRDKGGFGKGGPGKGGSPRGGEPVVNKPGRDVALSDVENYPEHGLYDRSIMRTFFIEFEGDAWETEMAQLKDYGVDIGATVIVDGKRYNNVGVRFRGNSSFFTVADGQKRSLNLTFDWAAKKQNLYGYRTLNLLNSHGDASFLRSVLYSRIAGDFTAAPKANYVHVVINGKSWGVYINEQQMNTDFLKENFGTKKGGRFKSSPGRGPQSFTYQGDDKSDYPYEIKSEDDEKAWKGLIEATKVLDQTPAHEIESKLDKVFSIDRALWFLAIDNVLLDVDGYYERGADYAIFQESKFGRTMILPYDNNETFRAQRVGQGGRGGRGGPGGGGPPKSFSKPPKNPSPFALDIFSGEDEPRTPIVSKLLANRAVKARYVAHVRTIHQQWINWDAVRPIIEGYRDLIGDEVKKDSRKLTSLTAYEDGIGMNESSGRGVQPGLKAFFKGRKAYLDKVPELAQPYPEFDSVRTHAGKFVAKLKPETTQPDKVYLHWSTDRLAKYTRTEMVNANGDYIVDLPADAAGKQVFYYVEGRTNDKYLTTSFFPATAESKPLFTKKPPKPPVKPIPKAESTDVVINEIMASNTNTIADSDGEFEDWIELANVSEKDVDLSGVYLSDSMVSPMKFKFPSGTVIKAGGFLIIWADGDNGGSSQTEFHAGFKLSKKGESILLVEGSPDGPKKLLDSFEFGAQLADQSFGRLSSGGLGYQTPTPGKKNSR